jgi:hypothetical protein
MPTTPITSRQLRFWPSAYNIFPLVTLNASMDIRDKILYFSLLKYEQERKRTLMQKTALPRAPRHFVRLNGEPCINKVLYFFSQLLYM